MGIALSKLRQKLPVDTAYAPEFRKKMIKNPERQGRFRMHKSQLKADFADRRCNFRKQIIFDGSPGISKITNAFAPPTIGAATALADCRFCPCIDYRAHCCIWLHVG